MVITVPGLHQLQSAGANTSNQPSLEVYSVMDGYRALMTWKGIEGDQRIFYSVFDGNNGTRSPPTPIAGANTSNQPSLEVSLNRRGSAAWYTGTS